MKTDSSGQLRDEQRMPLQPGEQVLSYSDENDSLSLSSDSIVRHLQQRTSSRLRTEHLFPLQKKCLPPQMMPSVQLKVHTAPRKTITKYPTLKMCTRTTTIMSGCGHTLLHYTGYCRASLAPRGQPCQSLQDSKQYLNDTCASCHPSFVESEINKRHADHRNRLMAAMRRAGTQEEVFQLQRAIEEASAGRRKEMSEVGKVGWNGIVVWGPEGFEGEEREERE
jgi:hypothetical protein